MFMILCYMIIVYSFTYVMRKRGGRMFGLLLYLYVFVVCKSYAMCAFLCVIELCSRGGFPLFL